MERDINRWMVKVGAQLRWERQSCDLARGCSHLRPEQRADALDFVLSRVVRIGVEE